MMQHSIPIKTKTISNSEEDWVSVLHQHHHHNNITSMESISFY